MPKLITHSLTKAPKTISELAVASGLKETEVRGCMYVLGNQERGIVRTLDKEQRTWEISHDFLVPLIDSIVARWYVSFWRRSRAFLPWAAAAVLLAAAGLSYVHTPQPRFGHLGPKHINRPFVNHGLLAFPPSRGDVNAFLSLAEVLGPDGQQRTRKILDAGKIVFHMTGSTGDPREAGTPIAALMVANSMENDFRGDDPTVSPAFLFLLGDQVLYYGEKEYYYSEFYSPYVQYPAPILALAGNHEGTALPAFFQNFCATNYSYSEAAEGLDRTAQIEPGVYFTFDAPFVRVIALYSNAGEGPGLISSVGNKYPVVGDAQLRFLETQLNRIKTERYQGAVIVAMHHDVYNSAKERSPEMQSDLNQVFKKTGVWPHAIISGHRHVYERYTRSVSGVQIPYIVAGNGGYSNPIRGPKLAPPSKLDLSDDDVTLNAYDMSHFGYLRITVSRSQLKIEYQRVTPAIRGLDTSDSDNQTVGSDSVTIDLNSHQLVQTEQ